MDNNGLVRTLSYIIRNRLSQRASEIHSLDPKSKLKLIKNTTFQYRLKVYENNRVSVCGLVLVAIRLLVACRKDSVSRFIRDRIISRSIAQLTSILYERICHVLNGYSHRCITKIVYYNSIPSMAIPEN